MSVGSFFLLVVVVVVVAFALSALGVFRLIGGKARGETAMGEPADETRHGAVTTPYHQHTDLLPGEHERDRTSADTEHQAQ